MNRPRSAAWLLATAGVLAASGCGTSTPAPTPPAPPTAPAPAPQQAGPLPPPAPLDLPGLATVNQHDPDAVSRAVVLHMYALDTTRQSGNADGLRRAQALLTPSYAANVRAAPAPSPNADYEEQRAHQAYLDTEVTPSAEDHPPDSGQAAYRGWIVRSTPIGRDGWRGPDQQQVALVTLTNTPHGWRVGQITPR